MIYRTSSCGRVNTSRTGGPAGPLLRYSFDDLKPPIEYALPFAIRAASHKFCLYHPCWSPSPPLPPFPPAPPKDAGSGTIINRCTFQRMNLVKRNRWFESHFDRETHIFDPSEQSTARPHPRYKATSAISSTIHTPIETLHSSECPPSSQPPPRNYIIPPVLPSCRSPRMAFTFTPSVIILGDQAKNYVEGYNVQIAPWVMGAFGDLFLQGECLPYVGRIRKRSANLFGHTRDVRIPEIL